MLLNRSVFSAAVIAATLTLGAAAHGQSRQTQQPTPSAKTQQPAPSVKTQQSAVEDKDIQAFANAASDVEQVQRKWIPTIAKLPDGAAQKKAQEQAMGEMVQAVQKNGLSVDKYNQIVELAQANPEIHRKIEDRLQQNSKLDEQHDELNDKEQ
jgi:hypothetical protein